MNMALLNSIWTTLKNESSQKNFDPDLICIICKTLLRNAYCGPCGCRYCYECISQYINQFEKYCPGITEKCGAEVIKFDSNIIKDREINRKISKIFVKCPIESCSFKDELMNIDKHMKFCCSEFANWSHLDDENTQLINYSDNFSQEIIPHSKSLFDFNNDVKDELRALKQNVDKLLREKEFLRNAFKANIDANQVQMWYLKNNQYQISSQMKEINQNLLKMTNLMTSEATADPIFGKSLKDLKKYSSEIDEKSTKYIEKELINNAYEYFVNLEYTPPKKKDICVQYLWNIDQFNEKRRAVFAGKQKEMSSEAFNTCINGYKMCLKLNFDVYSSGARYPIYQSLCLLKGKFDNELVWPFKYDITFELINPYTDEVHTSQTIYNYHSITHPGRNKPISNNKIGLGCFLIDVEEILNDSKWEKEDRIYINCIISREK